MVEVKPVPVESFMTAWHAANDAIARENVVPIELGKTFELDGQRLQLTDHPVNRAMFAVINALNDKELGMSAAFRIWSLMGIIAEGEVDQWVHPEKGVQGALLFAAAQCSMQDMELDLSDLQRRAEELLCEDG